MRLLGWLNLNHPLMLGVAVLILVVAVALIVILSKVWRKENTLHVRNEHEEKNPPRGKDGEMKP